MTVTKGAKSRLITTDAHAKQKLSVNIATGNRQIITISIDGILKGNGKYFLQSVKRINFEKRNISLQMIIANESIIRLAKNAILFHCIHNKTGSPLIGLFK
jgi:hypothetical protein